MIHQGWLVIHNNNPNEWRPPTWEILLAIRVYAPPTNATARNRKTTTCDDMALKTGGLWGAHLAAAAEWESVGPSGSRRGGKNGWRNNNFMEKGVKTFSGIKRLYRPNPVLFAFESSLRSDCVSVLNACGFWRSSQDIFGLSSPHVHRITPAAGYSVQTHSVVNQCSN